eukprot:Hpha_TRINITY_DN15503_c1_g2::TRINITY_DN15503_c1_g2_i1::g.104597::m.104597
MANKTPELMPTTPLVPPVKMRHDPYNTETSCATESLPPTPLMVPADSFQTCDGAAEGWQRNDSMNSMPTLTRMPLGEIQPQAGEHRFPKGVPAELILPDSVCDVSSANFHHHHHHHHHMNHHHHHHHHVLSHVQSQNQEQLPGLEPLCHDQDEPHHMHHHVQHHHHHLHSHHQQQQHHHHHHHVLSHHQNCHGLDEDAFSTEASPLTLPESSGGTPLMHSGTSYHGAQSQPGQQGQSQQQGVTRVVLVVNRRPSIQHPSSLYENVAPEPQWPQDQAGPSPSTPQTFHVSQSAAPPPPPPPPPPLVDLPPASTHESAHGHHWSPQGDLSFTRETSEVSLNQSASSWMPDNSGSHARLTRTGSDSEGLTETPPSRSTVRRPSEQRSNYNSRQRVEPQPPPPLYSESYSEFLVQVEFKFKRRDYFIATEAFSIGDHVKVDGDRGLDLGRVIHVRQICDRMDRMQVKTELRVHALASLKEVEMWSGQMVEEETSAAKFMSTKATQHRIPITVRRCEFQYDKRKLTCHYESQISHPDFRQLLKDGFHQYQCRIWMNNVTPGRSQRQSQQPNQQPGQDDAGWGSGAEDATVPDSARRRRSRGGEGMGRRRSGRGGRGGEMWAHWD